MSADLIRKASIEELCGHRDRALKAYQFAVDAAASADEAAKRAAPSNAYIGGAFVGIKGQSAYSKTPDEWRKSIDRDCWRHLLSASGLGALMGAKQRAEFEKGLQDNPPEFTVETAYATFADKTANAGYIFTESVVNAFQQAPRAFKSNDRFHVGQRMVFDYAINGPLYSPGWAYAYAGRQSPRDLVRDLDRIMHILDSKPHDTDATDIAQGAMSSGGYPGECETAYFRFRWFKKGTMHVWFLRDDLVRQMNRIIASHYGEALGAAA